MGLTDWAAAGVLEVVEGGVVGASHAGSASTSSNEAWTNIDGVCITGFHVDSRERWEWTRGRRVVVAGVLVWAAAWVEASEEEAASTLILEAGGGQLVGLGEQELKGAVGIGSGCGNVEAENGRNVVGGEQAVPLRTVGLIWLRRGDVGDVGRSLELSLGEVMWAAVCAHVLLGQGAGAKELAWDG